MAGQSPGCNSCSPITPVGSSIPAGSWDCIGDKPHVRHGALLGRAESSALLVSGTSPHWEQWWEVGKDTAPAQPPLPAPTCPTDRNLLALGGSPLCHRSLFNLPEVYLEDMGRCRKIFSEGKKKSEQRPFAAQEKKLKEMLQLQLCQTASGFSLLTLFKQTNSQHLETEAAHVRGKKKNQTHQ